MSANQLLEKVRADLRSKRGRAREVHEKTGVSVATLYRLRDERAGGIVLSSTLDKLRPLYEGAETAPE